MFLLAEHDPGGEQNADGHDQDDNGCQRIDVGAKLFTCKIVTADIRNGFDKQLDLMNIDCNE